MKQGKRYQRMEETRAQVLREAVVLFLEQGYRETTLEQIAACTGRTKSAVLRAYPDKEAILYALATHMFGAQFSCKCIPSWRAGCMPRYADPAAIH